MNFKQMDSVVSSLELQDSHLIEHVPYLFQDLWEISSNHAHMLDLLEQQGKTDNSMQVLDLCCGKGASLIGICKKLRCKGVGVDLNSMFIGDAKIEAFQHQVKDLVKFVEQDIAQFVYESQQQSFDLIIYGNYSKILGSPLESLNLLGKLLKEDGMLLYESDYSSYGFDFATSEHKDDDIEQLILNSDLFIEKKHVWDHLELANQFTNSSDKLRNRAHELQQQHPDISRELEAFVQQQEKKLHDYQNNSTSKATWLLSKSRS